MTRKTGADHRTVIEADQAAFVGNADGSFSLLLPRTGPDAPMSVAHQLIVAIAVRLDDPGWVEEMLASLDQANENLTRH
jgi:hypothetical protein